MNYEERKKQVKELMLSNNVELLMEYIHGHVYAAFIEGYKSTKGIGLNFTNAERADQYCKDKGLRE
jgi:hypothetical protein